MNDLSDDARLVAFLDNQLDGAEKRALEVRLAADAGLNARLARLRDGGLPFAKAFEAALAEAPLARLQAGLGAALAKAAPPPARATPWRRFAAVAAALALLVAGWATGRYVPMGPDDKDDWRDAVAAYLQLYTVDTFSAASGDAANEDGRLALLSARLGLPLTPSLIDLQGLAFRRADALAYDGAPLGEIGYLDAAAGPVAFCIIRNGEKDAPLAIEKREGLVLASWAQGGRGYLLAGRLSPERAQELAKTLAARL